MLSGDSMILTEDNDALGHLEKVKFIKKFIEDLNTEGFWDEETSDRLIALYGNRGSGKSSIMKTLSREFLKGGEDHTKFKTVFFEARRYEQDPNLALSLLHYICDKLEINLEEKIKQPNIMQLFRSILGGFKINGEIEIGIEGAKIKGGTELDAQKSIERYEKLQNEFIKKTILGQKSYHQDQEQIKQGFNVLFNTETNLENKKIIVFIDDLDRCEPEHVTNLLAAIKLFFTLSDKLIFVVGIDKDAVTKALHIKYNDIIKAEEYLEKIFMISFNVAQSEDIGEIINLYFKDDEQLRTNIIELCNYIGFNNPRHLKKLFNKVQYLDSHIKKIIKGDDTNKQIGYYLVYILFSIIYEFYHESWIDIDLNIDKKNNSYNNIAYNEGGRATAYSVNNRANIYRANEYLYYSLITYFLPVNQIQNSGSPFTQRIDYSLQNFLSLTSQNFKNEIHKKIIEYLLINEILISEFKTLEEGSTQTDQFDNEIIKKIIEFIKNSF